MHILSIVSTSSLPFSSTNVYKQQRRASTNYAGLVQFYFCGVDDLRQCQVNRSLQQNRRLAREILKSKLDEIVNGKDSSKARARSKLTKQRDRLRRRREQKTEAIAAAAAQSSATAPLPTPTRTQRPHAASTAIATSPRTDSESGSKQQSTDADSNDILASLMSASRTTVKSS